MSKTSTSPKVSNICSTQTQGTLDFDHDGGACDSVNDQIYLCFNYGGDEKLCRKSNGPLEPFSDLDHSNFDHALTGLAASDSELITV